MTNRQREQVARALTWVSIISITIAFWTAVAGFVIHFAL
jgi:hypothetical protein